MNPFQQAGEPATENGRRLTDQAKVAAKTCGGHERCPVPQTCLANKLHPALTYEIGVQ